MLSFKNFLKEAAEYILEFERGTWHPQHYGFTQKGFRPKETAKKKIAVKKRSPAAMALLRKYDPKMKEEFELEEGKERTSHAYKMVMKHAKNPSPAQIQAAKDIKPGIAGFRDRVDFLKDLQRTGKLKKENVELEETFKVGDTVRTKIGAHQGERHKVVHVHDNGDVNVTPMIHDPKRIKYRLGIATAKPHEVEHDDSPSAHAVHIDGKKWKSFPSRRHAEGVAKKISSKAGNEKKKVTVHKEEFELEEGNAENKAKKNAATVKFGDKRYLGMYRKSAQRMPLRSKYKSDELINRRADRPTWLKPGDSQKDKVYGFASKRDIKKDIEKGRASRLANKKMSEETSNVNPKLSPFKDRNEKEVLAKTKLQYKKKENAPQNTSYQKMKEGYEQVNEIITKSTPTSEVIHDFVHSKNPKFAGKSKKERIRMALGAKYAMMRNEDVELEEGLLRKVATTAAMVGALAGGAKKAHAQTSIKPDTTHQADTTTIVKRDSTGSDIERYNDAKTYHAKARVNKDNSGQIVKRTGPNKPTESDTLTTISWYKGNQEMKKGLLKPGSSYMRKEHVERLQELTRQKVAEIGFELRHEDEAIRREEEKRRNRVGLRRIGGPKGPHAVHIDGKKWKTFSSHDHAYAVVHKLNLKPGNEKKKITVHKEEPESK